MTETLCPVCKNQASRLDQLRRGDHHFFNCPFCGSYEVGGTFASTLSHGTPRPILSGMLRHSTERGEKLGLIDQWKAEVLEARAPKSIAEKATKLLEVVARKAPEHGQMMVFKLATDYPLAYGKDEAALWYILLHLRDEGLIRAIEGAGRVDCLITPKGWTALEVPESSKSKASYPAMKSNANPKVFISYSWDSDEHKSWVRCLAADLRRHGVDVKLDQWEVLPGDLLPKFMETSIRENDFVLIVLTPNYKRKSDGRRGGVGYEGDIMTGEVFAGKDPRKFITILRAGTWDEASPSWLGGKCGIDLHGDSYSTVQYENLLKALHGTWEIAPPLGPLPQQGFSTLEVRGTSSIAAGFQHDPPVEVQRLSLIDREIRRSVSLLTESSLDLGQEAGLRRDPTQSPGPRGLPIRWASVIPYHPERDICPASLCFESLRFFHFPDSTQEQRVPDGALILRQRAIGDSLLARKIGCCSVSTRGHVYAMECVTETLSYSMASRLVNRVPGHFFLDLAATWDFAKTTFNAGSQFYHQTGLERPEQLVITIGLIDVLGLCMARYWGEQGTGSPYLDEDFGADITVSIDSFLDDQESVTTHPLDQLRYGFDLPSDRV